MNNKIVEILKSLNKEICQKEVILRVECDNIETVFIKKHSEESIMISDDRKTLAYLYRSKSATYLPFDKIDMDTIKKICTSNNVELIKSKDIEQFDEIGRIIENNEATSEVVENVACAIDEVFSYALDYKKDNV